ncbi:esterase-like activity of phytase family protein [Oricola sp.]|uniref:esterase-like activity of phytase family protein n=1 Tax=Oricola sp. TaxID=1979950 RepID=UPI003BAB03B2
MTARRALSAFLLATTLCSAGFAATDALADDLEFDLTVRARAIEKFRLGSSQTRFGELEFAGGLELYGSARDFGALSGLHVFPDQKRFLGVTDTGLWYSGEIERDGDGRPTGLADMRMRQLPGAEGKYTREKWETDAEGITVEDGTAYVSFERLHRIAVYDLRERFPEFRGEFNPPVPLYELRRNKGFEALAVAPPASPLAGALVGITERSLDKARNIMGFVRHPDGKSFEFSVWRYGEFDITDAKFLPGGDLVLLERRFNVRDGVAMRLRRIDGGTIRKGQTLVGEEMLEADMRYQIDNLEGLAITVDPDGTPRLTIVSDDNHSILQRNLLLEFRLVGGGRQALRRE